MHSDSVSMEAEHLLGSAGGLLWEWYLQDFKRMTEISSVSQELSMSLLTSC